LAPITSFAPGPYLPTNLCALKTPDLETPSLPLPPSSGAHGGGRAGDDAWERARAGTGRASGRAGGQAVRGRASEQWAASFHSRCRTSGAARSPPLPSPSLPSRPLPCAAHLLLPARLRPSRALLVSASPDRAALAHPVLQQRLMIHPTPPPLARWLAGSSLRSCTHRHANHLLHPAAQPLLLLMCGNPAPLTQVGK
jgi:hypothetical protein